MTANASGYIKAVAQKFSTCPCGCGSFLHCPAGGAIAKLYTGEPEFDVRPEPEVIAEFDGWRMDNADSMLIPWLYNTCSVLSHQCPSTKWRQWMCPDDAMNLKSCPECGTEIPDSVLTVWHLYNADDLAKYNKQLHDTKLNVYPLEEDWDNTVYEDSSPLLTPQLDGPFLYDLKGELLNLEEEEMGKWNGTPHGTCPDGDVWLYNANEKLKRSGEEE
jgi:hypothetical protein